MPDWLQTIDWTALHWIRDTLHCGLLDLLMPGITALGNGGMIWLIAAAALSVSKKYRKYGIVLLAALAAGALVGNVCLKHLIARARPCWLESAPLLIASPTDFSFPSGHTLSSVIGACVLTAADRRFAFAAIPAAVLIAFSRLYLYVHFPSDVLAAALIGILIGTAAICLMKACAQRRER